MMVMKTYDAVKDDLSDLSPLTLREPQEPPGCRGRWDFLGQGSKEKRQGRWKMLKSDILYLSFSDVIPGT